MMDVDDDDDEVEVDDLHHDGDHDDDDMRCRPGHSKGVVIETCMSERVIIASDDHIVLWCLSSIVSTASLSKNIIFTSFIYT